MVSKMLPRAGTFSRAGEHRVGAVAHAAAALVVGLVAHRAAHAHGAGLRAMAVAVGVVLRLILPPAQMGYRWGTDGARMG